MVQFISRDIRVLSTRANTTKPNSAVVCYADVSIGLISIFGISVLKNKKGGGYWVALPANFGKSGKTFPVVAIEEPLRGELFRSVLEACKDYTVAAQDRK